MDIFLQKRLFPDPNFPIKRHYSYYFDTVFIAFSPFFTIPGYNTYKPGHQKSHKNYPSDKMIFHNAQPVMWKEIIQACEFKSYADLYKALKTSIGAYRLAFQRKDLTDVLINYTKAKRIFHPIEGHFEVLSKIEILKAFRLLHKNDLIIREEFSLTEKEFNLAAIQDEHFVDAINCKDYFIYDRDKKLLFAVDWDDFFFLICSTKENVDKIVSNLSFEGFYCDDETKTLWEFTNEEIEKGVHENDVKYNDRQSSGSTKDLPVFNLKNLKRAFYYFLAFNFFISVSGILISAVSNDIFKQNLLNRINTWILILILFVSAFIYSYRSRKEMKSIHNIREFDGQFSKYENYSKKRLIWNAFSQLLITGFFVLTNKNIFFYILVIQLLFSFALYPGKRVIARELENNEIIFT